MAPGSAKVISARFARLAKACQVVGLASTDMRGNFFSENLSDETVIFPICNKESKPSLTLEPPLVKTATTGNLRLAACSNASAAFSPTTELIDPPINPKSKTINVAELPPIEQTPVTIASYNPVLL